MIKTFFTFKKTRLFFETNSIAMMPFWLFSLFASLALMLPFLNIIFEYIPKIDDFNNYVVSNASLNDLDVGKRVSLFYKSFIGIGFLSAFVFLTINFFTNKGKNITKETALFLKNISLIGIVSVMCGLLMSTADFAVYFLLLISFFIVVEIRFNKVKQDTELILWFIFTCFPFVLWLYVCLKQKNFFDKIPFPLKFENLEVPVDPFLLVFVALLAFTAFGFYWFVTKKVNLNDNKNRMIYSSLPVIAIPAVISVVMELLNIINLRFDVVLNSGKLIYFIILLFCIVFSILVCFRRKETSAHIDVFNRYYLPVLVVGLSLIIIQPWNLISPENEFFETANHGLSIDHFFRYGSIPIVETFDAHMLSYQFFGYLYGIVNGYEPWAPILYVSYIYVFQILILFYVLRKVIGSQYSFIVIFLFPIIHLISNEFAFAGLLALQIFVLLRDSSYKNFYLFWVIAIVLSFFKLDVGFAATLSGIMTFLTVNYIKNKEFSIKKLLITGGVSAGIIMVLFVVLCLIKSINPVLRFEEFVWAAMSNQNWGVVKMGLQSHFLFRLSYFILPLLIFSLLFYFLVKSVSDKKFIERILDREYLVAALLFFLFFSFVFIFNAPRGIVRHNFEYLNIFRITTTAPFAVLMFVYLVGKKHRFLFFLLVFFTFYFLINLTDVNFKNKHTSLVYQSVNSPSFHEKFLHTEKFNSTRVRPTLDTSELDLFKKILDVVLTPEETYYDFSSKNYYHALTGRKNPSYVNQTPLMLNGIKAQQQALKVIEEQKIPIVLMPVKNVIWHGIDEVYVDYKYFLLSEYFYENYTPLFSMPTFDIYVLNSKKAGYTKKLESLGVLESEISTTNFSNLSQDYFTKNNVQYIPNSSGVQLRNTGANPFIIGWMEDLRRNNKINSSNENLPANMSFALNASFTGTVKIYYTLKKDESFSEEKAKEFPIIAGNSTVALSLPKMPYEIMFAINTQDIQIEKFSIISGSQHNVTNPEMIDYNIGNVPRLWAEKTDNHLFNKISPLKEPIVESAVVFDKSKVKNYRKGHYLFLEIESDSDLSGYVDLMDKGEKKASYKIYIVPGKHKYAVRVSTNYYWWHFTSEAKIVFTTPKALKITKCSIVSEDYSDELIFNGGTLSFSNITDENWSGGVSLKFNMLLFDYSPKKENLLLKYKKIKFKDGSTITVSGHKVEGNYINVYVKENLNNYNSVAPYPNPIEFVE